MNKHMSAAVAAIERLARECERLKMENEQLKAKLASLTKSEKAE